MRLFIALPIPDDIRDRIQILQGGIPGARWVAPENLHLTLRFLGDTERSTAEDVVAALSRLRIPAFPVSLSGLGVFGDKRRSRQVWAGTEGDLTALRHLQAKVEQAVQRAGFEPEHRKFYPHVTIARLKDAPSRRVETFLADNGHFQTRSFPVEEFILYRSHLGSEGARYEPLAAFLMDGVDDLSDMPDDGTDESWEEIPGNVVD